MKLKKLDVKDKQDMDFIIYSITYANCIREGKGYFSNKVAYYYYLNINIENIMNDIIPELINNSSKVKEQNQHGGGQSGGTGSILKLLNKIKIIVSN